MPQIESVHNLSLWVHFHPPSLDAEQDNIKIALTAHRSHPARPQAAVRGVALAVMLLLCPLPAGCLAIPEEACPDGECFPLDSAALSKLLAAPGAFDVLSYAEDFERLRVETSTVYDNQGQFAEIHWSVAKNANQHLLSLFAFTWQKLWFHRASWKRGMR